MSRRTLGWAIAIWATITWGGRIGLLTGPEADDPWTWIRVLGSLAAAAGATYALLRPSSGSRALLVVYAGVTVAVWSTSVVSVWITDHETAFRVVHTVLAAVSLALAAAAAREAFMRVPPSTPSAVPGPPGSPPR